MQLWCSIHILALKSQNCLKWPVPYPLPLSLAFPRTVFADAINNISRRKWHIWERHAWRCLSPSHLHHGSIESCRTEISLSLLDVCWGWCLFVRSGIRTKFGGRLCREVGLVNLQPIFYSFLKILLLFSHFFLRVFLCMRFPSQSYKEVNGRQALEWWDLVGWWGCHMTVKQDAGSRKSRADD